MFRILNLEPWNYSDKAKFQLQKIGKYYELKKNKKLRNVNLKKFQVLILRFGYKIDKNKY